MSLKEDGGAQLVAFRGLTFVSEQGEQCVLELGEALCIVEVVSHLVLLLKKEKESFNEVTLTWIQASFICCDGGSFVAGPIRTRKRPERGHI